MNEPSLWLETDYFEKFHCKGGACRNSCCENWQIAVSMREYFDLIGRESSPELHHRLECAFRTPEEPSPERFRLISPNWLGRCPMHDADGLCMLHRECGEDALPEICRVYPRSLKAQDGLNHACCSASCEAVIETLMEEEQLSFRFTRSSAAPELRESGDESLLRYAPDCMRILQNREHTLPERLLRICETICERKLTFPSAPRADALRDVLQTFEKLSEDSPSLKLCGADARMRYGAGQPDAYPNDARTFEERFPQWQRWFENILANHLLYAGFPCVDARLQPEEAVHGLCAAYGFMRVISISCSAERGKRDDVTDALSCLFRLIEHSPFYFNLHLLISDPLRLLCL